MKKVSLIYLAENNFENALLFFKKLNVKKIEKQSMFIDKDIPKEYINKVDSVEVDLIVIDATKDEKTKEYFKDIADSIVTVRDLDSIHLIDFINNCCTNDMICIVPTGYFYSANWLFELQYFYDSIIKSGAIGVVNKFEDGVICPLLTNEDTLEYCIIPSDNTIRGLCYFNKTLLHDYSPHYQLSSSIFDDVSYMMRKLGYNNYYIPSEVCINAQVF